MEGHTRLKIKPVAVIGAAAGAGNKIELRGIAVWAVFRVRFGHSTSSGRGLATVAVSLIAQLGAVELVSGHMPVAGNSTPTIWFIYRNCELFVAANTGDLPGCQGFGGTGTWIMLLLHW